MQPRTAAAVLPETLHPEQRLKLQQVTMLTGKGKSKIYAEISAGTFPAPEHDGPRWSRWRAGDVLDWLMKRSEQAARDRRKLKATVDAAQAATEAVPEASKRRTPLQPA